MRWSSWHNHTGDARFSYCAVEDLSIATYRSALESGPFAAFAITEHAFALNLPSDICWPHQWYYTPEKLWSNPTFREAKTIRFLERIAENRDEKRLFFGLEAEIGCDGSFSIDPLLRPYLDLVIGSVHFIPGSPDPIAEYFRQLDMLLVHDFDILGHPFRLLEEHLRGAPVPEEVLLETLRRAAAKGIAVEINGHTSFWGDAEILRRSNEIGYAVAFGLDAHHPNELRRYEYFETVLKKSGVDVETLRLYEPTAQSACRPKTPA